MQLPKAILKATLAGLAMTLTVACDKEPLQEFTDTCDETCAEEGICTDPINHSLKGKTDDEPYYCPPCGMG
ncbi:MAG: hypothetical protein AB8F78_04055 [Saprospiraceae bacterium]